MASSTREADGHVLRAMSERFVEAGKNRRAPMAGKGEHHQQRQHRQSAMAGMRVWSARVVMRWGRGMMNIDDTTRAKWPNEQRPSCQRP